MILVFTYRFRGGEKKTPKVVIRNQYFKHVPPKQCWSGKKVQMTEQAQVLLLC